MHTFDRLLRLLTRSISIFVSFDSVEWQLLKDHKQFLVAVSFFICDFVISFPVVVAVARDKFFYCLAVSPCNAIAPIIKCEWLIVVQYIQSVLTLCCCIAHSNEIAQNKTIDVLDDTKMSLEIHFYSYIHPLFSGTQMGKKQLKTSTSSPSSRSIFVLYSMFTSLECNRYKIWLRLGLGHTVLYASCGIMYILKMSFVSRMNFQAFYVHIREPNSRIIMATRSVPSIQNSSFRY